MLAEFPILSESWIDDLSCSDKRKRGEEHIYRVSNEEFLANAIQTFMGCVYKSST